MKTEKLKEEKKRWENTHIKKSTLKNEFTGSDIKVDVLYTPDQLVETDYLRDIGFPGEYPFTRGIYPTMYRGRPWTVRQYSGFGTAEESNKRYRFLLSQGQQGLSVAFDLATQCGYDSDNPLIEEEVGRVGVAIDSLEDMEILFKDIPLDKITTSFTINSMASIILAMYVALAEKNGIPSDKIGGTLQNDILKEYVARGTHIFPVKPSLRLITDTIEYCARHVPRFNPISIAGGHMKEAGASAVQEVAFTFSNALIYVQDVINRGLEVDEFAPRLSFLLLGDIEFFEEIAKVRAARRLWAKIMKERFGAKDPRSQTLRLFSGCACRGLTAENPLNNITRVAFIGLSCALAGLQAMSLASYDEAYAIPTEDSVLVSLHTHHIIANETGITQTVDPLAGSYYVESLTNEMEQRISALMEEIEEKGGMVKLIEDGTIQRMIMERSYELERKTQSGEKVLVGYNKYKTEGHRGEIKLQQYDPNVVVKKVKQLRKLKNERNNQQVKSCLEDLARAAKGDENLMPFLIDAVKEYATVQEITDVLKGVFGEYREPSLF
jgi:methylmalonyl-CoA mutase, N-terminal domain